MKNAIVYLTRSSQLELLSRSIGLLCDNFLPWNPADVFVFHEADADMSALRAASARANPTLCLVDFSSIPAGCETLTQAQRGYRSMCRFFANEWFLRSELDGYDFVMRMDVDSFILSPCRENLFARLSLRHSGNLAGNASSLSALVSVASRKSPPRTALASLVLCADAQDVACSIV